ncbi:MAG: hypothetical protein V4725_07995, partial [Bacteroidota bacterium]
MAFLFAGLFTLAFLGCKKTLNDPSVTSDGKAVTLATPVLSCGTSTSASINLSVCGGSSLGAPAGFSVQWMLKADLDALGGVWPAYDGTSPNFCKASFSGVPGCSQYNVVGTNCVTVNIGDNLFDACGASSTCTNAPLLCGTEYAFRAFAHNDPKTGAGKSAFTKTLICKTSECTATESCTYTQGYWKTHGPVPTGNNSNVWKVTSLTLGTVEYTDLQLLDILNTPAQGNGLVSLAHQLIAAKLNIASGADGAVIAISITEADALIGGLVIPIVGTGSLAPSVTSTLNGIFTSYNEGATGPGHCK